MAKHLKANANDELMVVTGNLEKVVKFLALVAFPAAATLYIALASVWNFPDVREIGATITAVDTFLGVLLGINSYSKPGVEMRTDGDLNVAQDSKTGEVAFGMALDTLPKDIAGKDAVTLKVKRHPMPSKE